MQPMRPVLLLLKIIANQRLALVINCEKNGSSGLTSARWRLTRARFNSESVIKTRAQLTIDGEKHELLYRRGFCWSRSGSRSLIRVGFPAVLSSFIWLTAEET
jgi:hypothetical protein